LTSIATSASVWLITIDPPDFSHTLLFSALSISAWTPIIEDRERLRELHLRRQFGMIRSTSSSTRGAPARCRCGSPEVLGQQIAQQPADDALLAEEHGRRARRVHALAISVQILWKASRSLRMSSFDACRGADDHAAGEAVRLAELAHDRAQPAPPVPRLDLARHADVIDGRHEDENRPGIVTCEVSRAPLVPSGSFDLDDDFGPAQQFFDLLLRPVAIAVAVLPPASPFGSALPDSPLGSSSSSPASLSNSSIVSMTSSTRGSSRARADVDEGGLHAG
jgi:hypothetical protein